MCVREREREIERTKLGFPSVSTFFFFNIAFPMVKYVHCHRSISKFLWGASLFIQTVVHKCDTGL